MNRVELIGRLGRDPETATTQSGDLVANLSIATDEQFKNSSGVKETRVEWHRVVIWTKGLAEFAQEYLRKGDPVFIAGTLRTRKWSDSDGVDRWSTEVVLSGPQAVLNSLAAKRDEGEGRAAA
jgi:single-strand DNA-binding protein